MCSTWEGKKTFLKLQQTNNKTAFVFLPGRQMEFLNSGTKRERKFLRIVQNVPCHKEWKMGKKWI